MRSNVDISDMKGSASFSHVDIDRQFIRQAALDIESERRTNALPWRGQFSPDFVAVILEKLSPRGLVVDPFCGSGTTLGEAARLGLSSLGLEVNAAAYLLARVHQLAEDSSIERIQSFNRVSAELSRFVQTGRAEAMRDEVLSMEDPRDVILASAIFLLTLGNGASVTTRSYERACSSLGRLLSGMGEPTGMVRVQLGDARAIPLLTGRADMIFTSPPYVNVFNYHQNYRKAVELLGYDVLPPARSEIGSNRKFRQNRFLTVVQYGQDTALALSEAIRVLRPGGHLVWVVGRESNVRGVAICNSQIAFDVAMRLPGLCFERRLERKFRSRYGALVYEDILIFKRVMEAGEPADVAHFGREVGVNFLNDLLSTMEASIASEVQEARDSAAKIMPSPFMR